MDPQILGQLKEIDREEMEAVINRLSLRLNSVNVNVQTPRYIIGYHSGSSLSIEGWGGWLANLCSFTKLVMYRTVYTKTFTFT